MGLPLRGVGVSCYDRGRILCMHSMHAFYREVSWASAGVVV